ncbi:hypothetical protein [Alicycliphilus denitrificans]|uniref:hypothetical protein n=1 Tax=Alicycliphilus denitrificans TaxID=179636 RepID=UPI003A7FA139
MIFVKTQAGQKALKERHGALSPRQRSAFILFDGRRTLAQVLAATAALGITQDDVQFMIDEGLLEYASAALQAREPEAPAQADEGGAHSASERYQAAYLIATELTASLGLRGFRLNLAVEGTTGFESLAALAPKIRDAVGEAKYERLERALFA